MTTRKEWEANERKVKAQVWARAMDADGVFHCERCGSNGKDDLRGLQLSHTKEKGSGGTRHLYTADEMQILCGYCHFTSPDLHNLREMKA